MSYARDVRCCLSGCFSVTNASLANKIWGKQDSNLRRRSHQIYSLAHLATLVFPRKCSDGEQNNHSPVEQLELAVGLEPTTSGLQNRSSAN